MSFPSQTKGAVTEPPAFIAGLGTALPDYAMEQERTAAWVGDTLDHDDLTTRRAQRLFRGTAIETRYSVLPDCTAPDAPRLYDCAEPDLGRRMDIYREEAPRLAERACRSALAMARLRPEEITHLVVVTSTGVRAPGPDVDLLRALGLAPSTERILISMMGCSGAFNGLSQARRIVALSPDARALVVCVELCSLHLRNETTPDQLIAQALFGDAAAAVVLRSDIALDAAVARLGGAARHVHHEGRDLVTWDLDGRGFRIQLEEALADVVGASVRPFVEPLLRETSESGTPEGVGSWVIHPGGIRILEAIRKQLDLPASVLESSASSYRQVGNVSSASVLFVLEREVALRPLGTPGIMLAVGPGLSFEALAFEHGSLGT